MKTKGSSKKWLQIAAAAFRVLTSAVREARKTASQFVWGKSAENEAFGQLSVQFLNMVPQHIMDIS
jgi:hypothetical protein